MRKKFFTKIICFMLAFSFCCISARAEVVIENNKIPTLIQNYMDARKNLISTNDESVWNQISVEGVYNDELTRADMLETHKIVKMDSSYQILNMNVSDYFVEVQLQEKVRYNGSVTENIIHEIKIMNDNDNFIILSDKYKESYINFASCSYVDTEINDEISVQSTTASSSCFIQIATNELGYKETGTNVTKYGKWYGSDGQPWCHMFVSWCANKAGISTSVIPKTYSCDTGMNKFINWNRFEYSKAYGNTYTPKVGDIIYFGTKSDSNHVGIITKVTSSKITTIEGNSSDKVQNKTYNLTDSSIVGYGNPKYTTSQHTFKASGSKYKCSVCGLVVTSIPGTSALK